MSYKQLVKDLLTKPDRRFLFYSEMGMLKNMSDEVWLRKMWYRKTGRQLNLQNPMGFNEKLQWIKLYDHNPLYTLLVDKVAVRKYVCDKVGADILVPSIGVWERAENINFNDLPSQFVLKCNHNSGDGMVICQNKAELDIIKVREKLNKALKDNYYYHLREWAYKDVKPKILGEKYMESSDKRPLIDYKFYCFNGEPKFLYVGVDKFVHGKKRGTFVTYLDMNFQATTFKRPDHEEMDYMPEKPDDFDEMIDISKRLSAHIPFVRVDLYWIDGHIYFSEMTLYPGGGYGFFKPDEEETRIGNMLVLPHTTFY